MTRLGWTLALLGLIGCGGREQGNGASSTPAVAQQALAGDIAIVGATVLPMDRDAAVTGQTILLRGDRIVALAPATDIDTRAATVVDASGKWVMPGLADMHVHLWSQDDLKLFLLNGVTTVRNLFGSPDHIRWRDAIARGELSGPTLITAGPILDGDPPTWPGSAVVTTAEAARAEVAAQQAAGYDWLKVYNGLSIEVYDAILDEAKRRNMPVAGHVPKAVSLLKAIGSGQRTIEHLDGYVPFFGEPPAEQPIALTVSAGIWNCPTLVVTENFSRMDAPEQLATTRGLELVSPMVRAAWDPANDFRLRKFTPEMFEKLRAKNVLRRKLVRDLHQAGARLVLGTDTGNPYVVPGFAVVDELKLLVGAGLTPWQALRMATAAAGELQGKAAEVGTIASGARADLVVLDHDPLVDVAHAADPSIVIARGKVHQRAELLAAVQQRPATAADRLRQLGALEAEGTPVVAAQYEVDMFGQTIGAEQAALSRLADGTTVVRGQAIYTMPQVMKVQYRSTRDALDLTTDAIVPPHVVVSRGAAGAVAVQDGQPPLELAAPGDAVLAPPTVAEFFWFTAALADLGMGAERTLHAVEVRTEGKLTLEPGTYTFTRGADADQRRSYTIAGKYGALDLTGSLKVDGDGAPHEVAITLKFGSFTFRRTDAGEAKPSP